MPVDTKAYLKRLKKLVELWGNPSAANRREEGTKKAPAKQQAGLREITERDETPGKGPRKIL